LGNPVIAKSLFKLLKSYVPETKNEKKERLAKEAQGENQAEKRQNNYLRFGLNNVTNLVERGTAKLVCIAHDVDPLELVLWLPQLCRRKNVPFLFVKGKAALGKLVHMKTATCVAVVDVNENHRALFKRHV
jgi:large subunit ribosomal protein L7Ae